MLYKLLISIHSLLLYLMALMAGNLHLLTQFISSQGLLLLLEISWIFWSKKDYLIFLTVFLNCFQSSIYLVDLYFSSLHLQLLSHQLLECLVILMIFDFSSHIFSIEQVRLRTTFSSNFTLDISLVLTELIVLTRFSIKDLSSLLSLIIVCFLI